MWITSKAGSSRYSIERERVQIKLKSPTPAPAVRMRHCGMNFLNLLFADRCGATGSCHPRRWLNAYQQWWKSAMDQLQHQHSMADACPLDRIWSWKIKMVHIQWGCSVFQSRWATYTCSPWWATMIDLPWGDFPPFIMGSFYSLSSRVNLACDGFCHSEVAFVRVQIRKRACFIETKNKKESVRKSLQIFLITDLYTRHL